MECLIAVSLWHVDLQLMGCVLLLLLATASIGILLFLIDEAWREDNREDWRGRW